MRRLVTALTGAGVLLGLSPLGALPGGTPAARAAEYTLLTAASYAVEPDERQIVVEVDVRFTNTTPNPSGQFSVFEVIDLAIHAGATGATARDADGELDVSVAMRGGVNVATIRPRSAVRYTQTAAFTLSYLLADGANPDVRVRPSAIVFPAWSFGTSGEVAVTLPAEYEVRVDGDDLTAEASGATLRLESGAVTDPTSWLARVIAIRPSSYATLSESVPLASGTVDLQVRAWADDEAWGMATLDLMTRALPLLEAEIGLDYPRVGPLVVVEAMPDLPGELSEAPSANGAIAVAFDEPDFTILHQAAHVWLSEQIAGERWIREGFASHAAAAVAAELEVDLPYEPEARAADLEDDLFPLISWGAGEASAEQDAWAYAASWALAERLAAATGEDALRLAWQRISAGVDAYEPLAGDPPAPAGRPVTPVDSRRLLDQLAATSGVDKADEFAASVFDEAASAELPVRAAAREAYDALLSVAGEWGAPDPVRVEMSAWRFSAAETAIVEALDWLADRDDLLAAIERVGLTTPERLRDRYRSSGGGPDGRAELEAEAAVVAAYREVQQRLARAPSIVERVGRLGGVEPSALLAEAGLLFGEGDLRGAAETVDAARRRLDGAAADGMVRLAAAAAVIVVLLAAAVVLARRRRGSDYTAAP